MTVSDSSSIKLCECGCGDPTPLYKKTAKARGIIKGEPCRFIQGHQHAKSIDFYKVQDTGYHSPCWIWQRAQDPWGYGNYYHKGKYYRAHRFFYKQRYGPIPEGKILDHQCCVTSCVNPEHVQPVSQAINVRRGAGTKLTLEKARKIRQLRQDKGMSLGELGNMFGVHRKTIRSIIEDATWREC